MAEFDYKQRPSTPDYRDNWERLYGKKSADASALSNGPESPKDSFPVDGSGLPTPITVTVKIHKAHLLAGKALIALAVGCAKIGAACIAHGVYVEGRTRSRRLAFCFFVAVAVFLIASIFAETAR